jgi:hypothetical protein
MPTQGIVTVAFGKPYQEEAGRLIRSVRKRCPNLPVCAITDQPWTCATVPDEVVMRQLDRKLEGSVYGWKAEFLYPESPFARTLYLDTDVLVCQELTRVFGLLDHYDIGFRFYGPPMMELPNLAYHPKCHGGVILYKKCSAVEDFFRAHLALFTERVQKARAAGQSVRIDDERTYAIALAQSQARPIHLDNYLAFHVGEIHAVWHPPLIYHGRIEEMAAIHEVLAADWPDPQEDVEQRLWLPRVRRFLRPMSARWRDPFLFGYIVLRKLFNWIRPARPRSDA